MMLKMPHARTLRQSCAAALALATCAGCATTFIQPDESDVQLARSLETAGLRPGASIANVLPNDDQLMRIVCDVIGASGRLHIFEIAPQAMRNRTAEGCTNVSTIELKEQKRSAPELWSSSDDPGAVYEYWSFTPALETFSTPEPFDAIWVSQYRDLHTAQFGSPHMPVVHQAWLTALSPRGLLLIEDHGRIERDMDIKAAIVAAGFEYGGSIELQHAHDGVARRCLILKFRKGV